MDPSLSGTRPPKRLTANKALELFHSLEDDDDPFNLTSDKDSSNEESSEDNYNSDDSELNEVLGASKKGALPTSKGGKYIPARGRGSKRMKVDRSTASVSPNTSRLTDLTDRPTLSAVRPTNEQPHLMSAHWQEVDRGTTENNFRFCREESHGVNINLHRTDEIDCLFNLLTDNIIDAILKTLNEYASVLCDKNTPPLQYSVFRNFEPVTRPEFLKFLAIIIAMGLSPKDSIASYWSSLPHLYTPWFSQMMSRNRFQAIFHTFLHAGGAKAESQEKIEPFLKQLTARFQECYYPAREVSIDEMVIGFKGRWKYKQYNASKPSKYHIKTFGLCDSETGYVINIFTYYGSSTAYHPDSDPDSTQAVKVFQTLLEPLEKGHHIFADRFYSSMPLLSYLTSRQFYFTGTMDIRRKGFPPALKTLKLNFMDMKWFMYRDNSLLAVAFRDKKAKKNCCLVTSRGETSATLVHSKKGDVMKPVIIQEYNKNMNGCDRADQQVQYYGLHKRKSYKWWKKIFHWLLEISFINASILFRKTRPADFANKHISLIAFKHKLVSQLCESAALAYEIPQAVSIGQNPVERLNGSAHFIETTNTDRNCKVCSKPGKRKRTTFICSDCTGRPHLCIDNCFKVWHTKLNL